MTVSNHCMGEKRVSVLSSKASSLGYIVLFGLINIHTHVYCHYMLTKQIHSSVTGTAFSHTEKLYMKWVITSHIPIALFGHLTVEDKIKMFSLKI